MRILFIALIHLLSLSYAFGQVNVSLVPQPAKRRDIPFTISAVDDKTSAVLPAKFTIQAKQTKQKFSGESRLGIPYSFTLTHPDTINVIASTPGYYEAEELMTVFCDTCAFEYVIRLEKEDPKTDSVFRNLEVNQAFRLDNVYFDQSSYVLRPESYPQLNKLVKTLIATPKLVIEIAGHTDNVGDRRLNQALSENRARIITNYLVNKGIPESRLRHAGYGSSKPAAPNDTEDNKRKNRRVEFVVLSL
ncbi:OmpA family protein [Spirosoma radiotolerans]|uniref:Flagellar motor protein MotB n=1 Tax=Spirosoma radiotolerans TaxID=1379870 RepID=A0A0E3ZWT8_9BACT|nr:OmpA family protein [Spirosoma radiotolerans]AKD55945.1 flagellar motor protein MotB [Spirosoma radiotolerans]